MDSRTRDRIVELLERVDDASLATVGEDGAPHATVVSHVNDGLTMWFATSPDGAKAADLSRDPRVSLTVTPPHEGWDDIVALTVDGRATLVEAPSELGEVGRRLTARHPEVSHRGRGAGVPSATYRIEPHRIALLDYRRGFGHVRRYERDAGDAVGRVRSWREAADAALA